jgi:hypothetical protein
MRSLKKVCLLYETTENYANSFQNKLSKSGIEIIKLPLQNIDNLSSNLFFSPNLHRIA